MKTNKKKFSKLAPGTFVWALKVKKEYVKSVLCEENLDVCCIQECEIKKDYLVEALLFQNYYIEPETNSVKSRCCTYIKNQ